MSVDDKKVQDIIDEYLSRCGWVQNPGLEALDKARTMLKEYRQQPGASLDLNYAAAEHYMFSRYLVAVGGVNTTQMRVLTTGYDAKKFWDSLWGDSNQLAVTSNPVSPPDLKVMAWGLKGATDGEIDFKKFGAPSPPKWRPLNEILPGKTLPMGAESRGY